MIVNGSSPLARGTPLRMPIKARGSRFIPACAGNSLTAFKTVAKEAVHPRLRGELAVSFSRLLIRSVHPRLRGELNPVTPKAITSSGSSPLARGTRQQFVFLLVRLRFIPACAGNSRRTHNSERRFAVHPRLRGELVRFHRDPFNSVRFIPACAGNSHQASERR